jgi:hypothetical protein
MALNTVNSNGRNLIGYDDEGRPVPFSCCKCRANSKYGKDGLWWCDQCWITDQEAKISNQNIDDTDKSKISVGPITQDQK